MAGLQSALPLWLAVIVHVPAASMVITPPLVTVHTAGVAEVYSAGRLDEAVAAGVGAA